MPLWRLQRLRNEVLDFFYAKSPMAGTSRLKHGVAANLRRFHAIIVRLAQSVLEVTAAEPALPTVSLRMLA